MRDGTGSSSVSGFPPPRIARSATITPATNTTTTSDANTMDNVPWMNVLRMILSTSAGVFAVRQVFPASLAAWQMLCCFQ